MAANDSNTVIGFAGRTPRLPFQYCPISNRPRVRKNVEGKSEGEMRDCTTVFNGSGEHVATIGFNESHGLWQIVVVQREALEFFCPSKEVAFAAWHDEFDPETGFPRSTSPAGFDS